MARVAIVMGSDSDLPVMENTVRALKGFGIPCEVFVMSAHRTPERVAEFAKNAAERGFAVIIAGAGGAAHLAGVIASMTVLPVIGVPIGTSSLGGVDSLLSTMQMPKGVPVATVAVGEAGAFNAGVLAAEILALEDQPLRDKLLGYRKELAKKVEEKNASLQAKLKEENRA